LGRGKTDKFILRRHAKNLRTNTTDAERHLWYYLRANRLGFKFKRQVPIKSFIVDFVCYEKRLIIELDGGQHLTNQTYDLNRTLELNKFGFQVLRFWNNDVLRETPAVLELIQQTLSPTLSRELHQQINHLSFAGEGADRGN
jgi:very-short-patch-repair endonuclease